MLNKYLGKSDRMLNKTIVILLALLSIMSVTSCSKKPKLDSDIDVSSLDTISSEEVSIDSTIGEAIVFDEKELVEDLNYKLLSIMNERNYFSDSDGLLYKMGEYSYRVYQDNKFTNCIYVIAQSDAGGGGTYSFAQSEEVLKYVGRDMKDYFAIVENEKIAEGRFTYEEVFEPAYGDNGIDYEVIANSVKKNYDNREFVDGSQGSKVYFRNQYSWDASRGNGTFYYEIASYSGMGIDALIFPDSGNVYYDGIYTEYAYTRNGPTPDRFREWHLGMMRHSLQEFGFTEAHQRMVDRIIETSPYNFELKISAVY